MSFLDKETSSIISMSSPNTPSTDFRVSDTAFNEQVASTREALKIFSAVTAFNAAGPARVVLEELVDVTVNILSYFL